IIPANGSLNIYMQILSNDTEFDGVYWGANPLWTSTYGQYDNGANVFSFYDNFAGTSLKSVWTVPSGSNYIVNNGFIATPSSTTAVYNPSIQETSSIITEWLLNLSSTTFPEFYSYFQLNRYTSNSNMHFLGVQGSDTFYNNNSPVKTETILSSGNQIFGIWNDGTTVTWYYPTSSGESSYTDTSATAVTDYVSLGWSYNVQSYNFPTIYWVRVRAYPPNGTDPVLISITLLLVGSYTSASNPVPDWKILKGKPYVTVSAKGISNGLSNIPNDGADFGPDTPGTMTSGIQEAVNYIFAQGGGKIQLLSGIFNLDVAYVQQKLAVANSYAIEIPENPDANGIMTIEIAGVASSLWDYQVTYNPSAITPVIGNAGSIIFFNGYLNAAGSVSSALFGSAPPTSANKYNNNVNILLTNLTFRTLPPTTSTQYQPSAINLDNFAGFILTNVAVDIYTADGSIPNIYTLLDNYSYGILVNPPSYGNGLAVFDNVYIVGYGYGLTLGLSSTSYPQHQHIKKIFIQFCVQGLTLGNVGSYNPKIDYADIEQCTYPVLFTNTSSIDLLGAYMTFQSEGAWSSTFWSNAKQIFTTTGTGNVFGEIDFYASGISVADTPLLGGTNPQLLATLILHQMNTYGSAGLYPYTSYGVSIAGPTAGTIQEILVSYRPIMKYILYFDGYENDTTNTFPIYYFEAFSSFVAITANTTGLSLELVGLTELVILTTGSTTTYSGIVILEGY
ncbi:MAG: hypothetical protein QW478_11540, partial [Candidatus Micrarchaeaceae archaeon]